MSIEKHNKKSFIKWVAVIIVFVSWALTPVLDSNARAQEKLKFSCSAQVYQAFEKSILNEFTRDTGIEVDVYVSSSGSALYRLMTDFSDIAATTRELYRRHRDYGYVQIPICKDPLAVIAKKGCGIDSLSEEQLRGIFSGDITNWKQVGGADLPIVLVVPDEDTGANKNFRRQIMKNKEFKYDFMAYNSTDAIELVKQLPCGSLSFTSQGAAIQEEDIRIIKIDGHHPGDKDYPYFQIFYFITKGEPKGAAKKLIDFSLSEKSKSIMRERGMLPTQ